VMVALQALGCQRLRYRQLEQPLEDHLRPSGEDICMLLEVVAP